MDAIKCFLIGVITLCLWKTQAQEFYVASPNTLRLNADETVAVFSHQGIQNVTIYLTDYPGRRQTFSEHQISVHQNDPVVVKVRVEPENIPDFELTGPKEVIHVILVVKTDKFEQELKINVNPQSGYVFLQTDKPIYNPEHTVNIRILILDEDMSPSNTSLKLEIKNPQKVIVESVQGQELNLINSMVDYQFNFPKHPTKGEWTVAAHYGQKVPRSVEVNFQLEEYVLPTFEVKLKVQDSVLPNDNIFEVTLTAKYVYGKPVIGSVQFKFGVMTETGHINYFGRSAGLKPKELHNGKTKQEFNLDDIRNNRKIGWFPLIKGSRLLVEATVTEESTGNKETKSSSNTLFATSPYLISFKRCTHTFKPGAKTYIEAEVQLLNGEPATNVDTEVKIVDEKGEEFDLIMSSSKPSTLGRVVWSVQTEVTTKRLHVEIVTVSDEYSPSVAARGSHQLHAYQSLTGAYVALEKEDSKTVYKVGENVSWKVTSHPDANLPISYTVLTQGRIVQLGSLLNTGLLTRTIELQITPDMIPSSRVAIFASKNQEMISDSIKFDVEDICRPAGQINISLEFQSNLPGSNGTIVIKGAPNTAVGVTALDTAVLSLRDKDLLTMDKVFREMELHDGGCGPGGGITAENVLTNAGLVLVTESTADQEIDRGTERLIGGAARMDVSLLVEVPSCLEKKRKRRSTLEQIHREHSDINHHCCKLGTYSDKLKRKCQERADFVRLFEIPDEDGTYPCSQEFLKCCEKHFESAPIVQHSKSSASVPINEAKGSMFYSKGYIEEDESNVQEENTRVRGYFPETWLFQTDLIPSDGNLTISTSLPDSITTWLVQAVGVSPLHSGGGICVAEPRKIVGFKQLFLQVKLPYSVVRNEQFEMQVTVFNYGGNRLKVIIYMYGVEGLCSEAQPGEKSEEKRIYVNPRSSASTTFNLVPLNAKDYEIKVVATSRDHSDIVVKTLKVIPEGFPHEENIVFHIDPSNTQKRKRRNIHSYKYTSIFDDKRKQQSSVVELEPEIEFVPGTESCYITAIGDTFGPSIKTSLEDPDKLIRLPQGCGEQTMAYMAPTLYTLHYLKLSGVLTQEQETNGYKYMKEGYKRELTFRKENGSYSAWVQRPPSTWLTAFVAKVFCQANKYIFIDDQVICSALKWLTDQQEPDGSFVEGYPIVHKEMMGGVQGAIPLTAFVLIAMEKCDCNLDLNSAKNKSVNFLKEQLNTTYDPYMLAISTYALTLYDPEIGTEINSRLLKNSYQDLGLNLRYWGDGESPISIESTSYALLTQLLLKNNEVAASAVNWLNSKKNVGGSFWSTQDTVIAIEALAEYAIVARTPDISLSCNISSSNDIGFKEKLNFHKHNARVLRAFELPKLGGKLHFEAEGSGVSSVGVKLRYHTPVTVEDLCKFDLTVNVSVAKEEVKKALEATEEDLMNLFPVDMRDHLGLQKPAIATMLKPHHPKFKPKIHHTGVSIAKQLFTHISPTSHGTHSRHSSTTSRQSTRRRTRRFVGKMEYTDERRSKHVLNVTICAKYHMDYPSNMAVINAGIFSGYKPNQTELKDLVLDTSLKIARFEINDRNVIFYLDEISNLTPTCFSFKIIREYLISNLESSVVKIYDYYDPGRGCSTFYRPEQSSALIRTKCEKNICECAEGGCPPKEPFANASVILKIPEQRRALQEIVCEKHDFVWKVRVTNKVREASGFLNMTVMVIQVMKEGAEKNLESLERFLIARGHCPTANLEEEGTYLILGRDQEPISKNGVLKYRYYLDQTTAIYKWLDRAEHNLSSPKVKTLHSNLLHVETLFRLGKACSY